MMLSDLQPEDVFKYFEEISAIPRGSENTLKIREYLKDFAAGHDLECFTDSAGNTLIKKPGSTGRESEEPVILQGHIDMVAVKIADSKKDMLTEGLDLAIEEDFICAKGTSLGADNGIAVAYMLALLAGKDYCHPPLECLFTDDEEIGLLSAANIDLSNIQGKRLINMDSEAEDTLTVGCAGGIRINSSLRGCFEDICGTLLSLELSGLSGGHSGIDIHKGRANAIILMARILRNILSEDCCLISFDGGDKDNAIASKAKAVVICRNGSIGKVIETVENLKNEILSEYSRTDPDMKLYLTQGDKVTQKAFDAKSSKRVVGFISSSPYGVIFMSNDVEGLVETSANIGVISTGSNIITVISSVRSSVSSRKKDTYEKIQYIAGSYGGESRLYEDYPSWEYKEHSPLRDKFLEVYQETNKTPMKVQTLHAGLECGYFSQKIDGLDCISIGPNMYDVHSAKERLSISSTKRVWECLLETLKRI